MFQATKYFLMRRVAKMKFMCIGIFAEKINVVILLSFTIEQNLREVLIDIRI